MLLMVVHLVFRSTTPAIVRSMLLVVPCCCRPLLIDTLLVYVSVVTHRRCDRFSFGLALLQSMLSAIVVDSHCQLSLGIILKSLLHGRLLVLGDRSLILVELSAPLASS
jgi:hypothetical protein